MAPKRRLLVLAGVGAVLIAAEAIVAFWPRNDEHVRRRPAVWVSTRRPIDGRYATSSDQAGLGGNGSSGAGDNLDSVPGTERGGAEISRIVEELQQERRP